MQSQKLIIFSDLDGTLLDHHSYSWEPARPALEKLSELCIPLILCTSKTAAEVSKIHIEMVLETPFIVENGAAIVFPQTKREESQTAHFFGRSYQNLLKIVDTIRSQACFQFTGFSDMSPQTVAKITGLPLDRAELAKQRLCSEPLLWDDDQEALDNFRNELDKQNLKLLQGGRFYHVLDKGAGKGNALNWLLNRLSEESPGSNYFSVALGDGPNDMDMLEAADLAVIIPSANGHILGPKNSKTLHATEPGPAGWNRIILHLLEFYFKQGADHG